MNAYDYIVVGAGLAGGIIARKLAEEKNKKVKIVERRNHIAGNAYDFEDVHGVRVQKYGPHVIHTDNDDVYRFLTRFCTPVSYRTKCEAVVNGISTPSPFNFKTIDQFCCPEEAKQLKRRLVEFYDNRPSVTVVEMLECEDDRIREFAHFLFENDYKPYTAKQWNLDPSEINPLVLKRVPIVLSYGDTYFYDKYEFIPSNGYVELFKNIIDFPNITVELNVDAIDYIRIDDASKRMLYNSEECKIIYTGAIDELFGYKFGALPYRSLYFDFQSKATNSFQNVAIVAYPQAEGYTRVTEYTKMPFQDCDGWTCAAYEYPVPYDKNAEKGNEPYYPVLTDESQNRYAKYKKYAEAFKNLTLVGRLAEFKYYNIDQVILRALGTYKSLEG